MPGSIAELEDQPQLTRVATKNGYEMICGITRGMIFWGEVRDDEHRDMEQFHGVNQPCPWLVLSSELVHRKLPLVIAAPLTSKLHKAEGIFRSYRIRIPAVMLIRYNVRRGGSSLRNEDSLVLTEQIRSLAHARLLGDPIAHVEQAILDAVEVGSKVALDYA